MDRVITFRRNGDVTVDGRVVGTWMRRPDIHGWQFENLGGRTFVARYRDVLRDVILAAFDTQPED